MPGLRHGAEQDVGHVHDQRVPRVGDLPPHQVLAPARRRIDAVHDPVPALGQLDRRLAQHGVARDPGQPVQRRPRPHQIHAWVHDQLAVARDEHRLAAAAEVQAPDRLLQRLERDGEGGDPLRCPGREVAGRRRADGRGVDQQRLHPVRWHVGGAPARSIEAGEVVPRRLGRQGAQVQEALVDRDQPAAGGPRPELGGWPLGSGRVPDDADAHDAGVLAEDLAAAVLEALGGQGPIPRGAHLAAGHVVDHPGQQLLVAPEARRQLRRRQVDLLERPPPRLLLPRFELEAIRPQLPQRRQGQRQAGRRGEAQHEPLAGGGGEHGRRSLPGPDRR